QQEHQQSQQELAKLRVIENKVQQVQDKLTTRLPHQRSQLIARVCGSIWLNRVRLTAALKLTTNQEDAQSQYEQIVKKMRMELGAFDYQVKEQGELLTRYLCELDNILSFGNAEVKDSRKALVVYIQGLLTTADAFRAKSAKLKELGEKLLATLPKPATEDTVVSESNDTYDTEQDASEEHKSAPTKAVEEEEESNDVDMKPLFAEEEEDEEDEDDDDDEDERDDDEDMDEGAPNKEEVESQAQNQATETQPRPFMNQRIAQRQQQQHQPAVDVRSLPLWRPYYQLQKRRDGLYLVAHLRDVDPQNLRVQWNEQTGVLRVSGHKLPTQKDLMVSRFSGVPAFGRFEIAERLPANAFNMDHATQKLNEDDGTLEI
ncbi:Bag domain, partial [Globisporangium polare]